MKRKVFYSIIHQGENFVVQLETIDAALKLQLEITTSKGSVEPYPGSR